MTFRAGVIGCGRMGFLHGMQSGRLGVYSHSQAYAVCPLTSLAAVCDLSPKLSDECAQHWGARAYTDPHEMMTRESLDIISICTPDETHYDLAMAALARNSTKAIFLEKPLALDMDQAREVVEVAGERGVVLAVNYMRRYSRDFQAVSQMIADGGLGEIVSVGGWYTKGVMHNGSHWFDLARWLVGEIAEARGFPTRFSEPISEFPDPCLEVALVFANGVRGYLHAARWQDYSIFEMDILGSSGRLRLVDSQMCFQYFQTTASPYYAGYTVLEEKAVLPADLTDSVLHGVEDLVSCLQTGASPACNGEDALAALSCAHAAVESCIQ